MMVGYGGIYEFQINDYASYGRGLNFYNKGKEFSNPFNNIGIGVGCLFAKLTIHTDYPYNAENLRDAPSIGKWMDAVRAYNGSGPQAEQYYENVWSVIMTGWSKTKNYRGSKRL
jgi:hypothetical protein